MKVRIAAAFAFVLLAAVPGPCLAIGEEERIEAVTQFLVDRAKANYLYIYQLRIARNETVRCYFPNVHGYLSHGDFRILLKSRNLWRDSLSADLEQLLTAAAARAVRSLNLRRISRETMDRYLEAAQYLTVAHHGKALPLTFMPLDSTPEERDLVNGFYRMNTLGEFLIKVDAATRRGSGVCAIPEVTKEEVARFATDARAALADLDAWRRHLEANAGGLAIDPAALEAGCRKAPAMKVCALRGRPSSALAPVVEDLKSAGEGMRAVLAANAALPAKLLRFEKDVKAAQTATERVILAIQLLRDVAPEENDEIIESLKKYVLFFAEISDAQTVEGAKAVLEEYTLPAVSFGLKREKYKDHLMLSTYVAYAYGKILGSGDLDRRNNKGIYAPIGIEFTRGLGNKGSLSAMAAPFDFGYPISLKLNGTDQGAKLADVIAPSFAASYGLASYPLTLGVAYQRGRKDPASNEVEKRVMLFFGFDMPLFPLF